MSAQGEAKVEDKPKKKKKKKKKGKAAEEAEAAAAAAAADAAAEEESKAGQWTTEAVASLADDAAIVEAAKEVAVGKNKKKNKGKAEGVEAEDASSPEEAKVVDNELLIFLRGASTKKEVFWSVKFNDLMICY